MRSVRFMMWGIGIFILLGTTACGLGSRFGGGASMGSETLFAKDDSVFVVCSEECSARAQCGIINNNGNDINVVLMSANFPASRNHDVVMQDNLPMTVLDAKEEQMIIIGNETQIPMNYYLVESPEGTDTIVRGWIQGSCVSDQEIVRE